MPNEEELNYTWYFPSLTKAFDALGEYALDKPFWVDGEGNKEYYDDTYWSDEDNESHTYTPITKDRLEYCKNYIKRSNKLANYNTQINNLVMEEAAPFFNNQKSAKEVSSIVQSRVSIYVKENK